MLMEKLASVVRPVAVTVIRILRRKTVLALIFCLSFAYCMTSLYYGHRSVMSSSYSIDYGDAAVDKNMGSFRRGGLKEEDAGGGMIPAPDPHDSHDRRVQYFNGMIDYSNLSEESNKQKNAGIAGDKQTCRNSVQGKVLIADDRGFICQRKEVSSSGCCDDAWTVTKRYSCDTCNENHCCAIYEYCISCCLHPKQKELLSSVLHGRTPSPPLVSNVVAASLTDHYDFCLARCRTSSHSVQHENSYRDPKAKHCFGPVVPDPKEAAAS